MTLDGAAPRIGIRNREVLKVVYPPERVRDKEPKPALCTVYKTGEVQEMDTILQLIEIVQGRN